MSEELGVNWDACTAQWYEYQVRGFVQSRLRDFGEGEMGPAVEEWFVQRASTFCRWITYIWRFPVPPEFQWPGHWELRWGAMEDAFPTALTDSWNAMMARQEREDYPTLDAWLSALHTGDLEWSGPAEPRFVTR